MVTKFRKLQANVAGNELKGLSYRYYVTSSAETSSLSRVVRDDENPCSVPLSW